MNRFLAIIMLAAVFLVGCHRQKPLDYRHGKVVAATQVAVLEGGEFDIKLVDGERLHGFLPVSTPKEAKEKVIKLLNPAQRMEVILLKKVEKGWLVNILFVAPQCNGTICSLQEANLVDWLKEHSLAWE